MTVQESVVPAVRRRRRSKPVIGTVERQAPVEPLLPPALDGLFQLIAEPVLKLETSPDGQQTLREIGILLGDVLDLLEEDQAILQTADELYEAAFGLQEARGSQPRCAKFTKSIITKRTADLHRTLAKFRKSLCSAKPSARARVDRLGW